MSKERDLLKQVVENFAYVQDMHLIVAIQKLLAQPENKREPLSDDAICEILLKKEWKGFVDLVRIIEKAHGIGGGE
jgi:DNA-directed RNA polymerase specialized sigma54-like protein